MKYLFLILSLIHLTLHAQEHVTILSKETTYEILSSDNAKIIEVYEIKINSPEGKRFSYFTQVIDEFRKLKSVDIIIKNGAGEKVKRLDKNDGREYGFNQSYEMNDGKIFVINPEYQQYPYTMEIKSVMNWKGFISLPTWVPRSTFNLGVSNATLKIKHSNEIPIRIREENITRLNTEKEKDYTTIEYEVKELAAISKTVRYKDFYELQPKVMLSPEKFKLDDYEGDFSSWSSFGNWFLQLNDEPYELTDETKTFIENLPSTDVKKKVSKVYKYMQEKTRYISIQLGIGGYKSMPTEQVEEDGYGDCKALTTYMKNMLDYAGIKSNYILVQAGRDSPDVIADFPSNQFNHVYLGIASNDTLYLECTSQSVPPFYTGQFTDDRNVLWIEKGQSKIIRSKVYDIDENVRLTKATININDKGDADITINTTNKGIFFDEMMIYESGSEEYINKHNQNKFWYRDFSISDFSFHRNYKDSAIFQTDYNVNVNGFGKKLGDRLILPINALNPISEIIDESELKEYASIPRAMTIEDEVVFTLPGNFWIYNLPDEFKVDSKYGSYSLKVNTTENRKLVIKRVIQLNKGEYLKESYTDFNKFYKKLEKAEKKKLVLNSKT